MLKKFLIFGALIAVAGIAFFAYPRSASELALELGNTPEPTANWEDTLSLEAMRGMDFDGRDLKLGAVQASTALYTRYFVTYTSGDLTISGIMNIPKGTGPADGFPVLILNHGYIDPDIYTNGRGLRREQDYLASHGFAVLHPDYRNHAQSDKDPDVEANVRTGYVQDVINAIYALQAAKLPQIDAQRVGMLGHSMGGGVAQAVMVVRPDLVKAFVLYAPVSSKVADSFYRWTTTRPEIAQRISETYGDPVENPDFWESLSPRSYFEDVQAPIVIFHGTADDSVPISWSRDTLQLLQNEGKDVRMVEYPREGHEFGVAHTDFMAQTAAFFQEHL